MRRHPDASQREKKSHSSLQKVRIFYLRPGSMPVLRFQGGTLLAKVKAGEQIFCFIVLTF